MTLLRAGDSRRSLLVRGAPVLGARAYLLMVHQDLIRDTPILGVVQRGRGYYSPGPERASEIER